MAQSLSDLKHGYYAAALGYTLEEAVAKSLSDLEYEYFSGDGAFTPPEGTEGQVLKYDASGNIVPGEDNFTDLNSFAGSTTPGAVLTVNATGDGFEFA